MNAYFTRTDCNVVSWIHAKNRLPYSVTLTDFLRCIIDKPVQIAYLNVSAMNNPINFKLLCDFIQNKKVWAINLGECEFNKQQCQDLIKSIQNSNICFMFVDVIFVGTSTVTRLKSVIREHRDAMISPPWLFGNDMKQNLITMQCKKMWWNATSTGRNKIWISSHSRQNT